MVMRKKGAVDMEALGKLVHEIKIGTTSLLRTAQRREKQLKQRKRR